MNNIHPSVILGKNVKLGENVEIKPYCVIEGDIEISDNCVIGPFSHITGWAKIGKGTRIFSGAAIGEPPQDYSFNGEPGLIEIGESCIIREGVTIHTPIHGGNGEKTIVGDNVFLMANSHVGHNSKIGSNSILTNGCLLAGFVVLEESTNMSGNSAVHQNCRVGAFAMIGGLGKVVQDVPPFMIVDGNPAKVYGLNVVGLRRGGFNQEQRTIIKDALRMLYGKGLLKERLAAMEEKYSGNNSVLRLISFVRSSKRGIVSYHGE